MIYGFNAGEAFKIAIEIEENGRLFYEKAQKLTTDADVVRIFAELGQAEVEHKKRFAELMAELPASTTGATVWDPDNEIDKYLKMMADMHVFSQGAVIEDLVQKAGDAAGALRLAIQFEKDSIVFFAEMQNLSEGAQAREKIGQLVKEEQDHLRKLSTQLFRLPK